METDLVRGAEVRLPPSAERRVLPDATGAETDRRLVRPFEDESRARDDSEERGAGFRETPERPTTLVRSEPPVRAPREPPVLGVETDARGDWDLDARWTAERLPRDDDLSDGTRAAAWRRSLDRAPPTDVRPPLRGEKLGRSAT